MSRAVAFLFGAALLSLGACGRQSDDFYVHDTEVVVATDAPFAAQPTFPARLERVVSTALAYWGGDWKDLAGRKITLAGTEAVSCGEAVRASGCYDGDVRVSTYDPGVGTVSCVEQTVLVHEIGHAVIGDPSHHDPRWMEFDAVAEALAGSPGYGPEGPVDCTIHVSVWRHLLDRS